MADQDVDLALIPEINREITVTANLTLTRALHRNAYLICNTAGVTITSTATQIIYLSGGNFSAGTITIDGVTIGSMQMFSLFTDGGGNSIVKASS